MKYIEIYNSIMDINDELNCIKLLLFIFVIFILIMNIIMIYTLKIILKEIKKINKN